MIDGITHYKGCWQSGAKHYECAVRELAACSAQFDRQQEQLDRNAEQIAALRDALSQLIEVHDAMGGMCGTARIAAEEALLGKAHREKNGG